jgi:hypothetical protein
MIYSNFFVYFLICVIMYSDWTTNDLATTRPFKGVVSNKTGRAGAMAYLKHASAPPDLGVGQRIGRQRYCQPSVAVLYTLDDGDRQTIRRYRTRDKHSPNF